MKSLDQTFAEYLIGVRHDLTYAACAEKLEVAESTLYRLINRKQSATLAMVAHIATRLGERVSLNFGYESGTGSRARTKLISKLNLQPAPETLALVSSPAIKRIAEIKSKADAEIAALRQEAISEIVKRLSEVKQEIRTLKGQYAQLTGKPLPGASSSSAVNEDKPARKRLSPDEKEALVETVRGVLAANPNGISMGELVRNSGESIGAVREALSKVQTKTTGAKSGTRYFLR
jgi:transcriptional regulator with XRE-family HTH domain